MSALWETVKAGIQQRRDQLQAGATAEEAASNLEKTIRAAWPQVRAWHYLCEACRDSGWHPYVCPGDRPLCGHVFPHTDHDYVEPCQCSAGDKRRSHRTDQPQPGNIGRVSRKPSRFGA